MGVRRSPPARVDERIDLKLENVWTLAPGIIQRVNTSKMSADVEIKVKIAGINFPVVRDVPIAFERGKDSIVLTPIVKGDIVLVGFSKFGLQEALIDSNVVEVSKARLSLEDAIILGRFVLEPEKGTIVVGTQKFELPTTGMKVLSDEVILVEAPDIRVVSDDELVGFEIDGSAAPGIDFETTGPVTFLGLTFDLRQTPLKNIKHRTADPAVGDLEPGEINTGLVGGVGKIYFKQANTIFVFNHDATIT